MSLHVTMSMWVLLGILLRATALGFLSFPSPRNVGSSCEHCATGASVCGNGANSHWNASWEPSNKMSATISYMTVLYENSVLTVGLYIKASPGGTFVLELCEDPGEVIEESCFKRLQRDPTDTKRSPIISTRPEVVWVTTSEKCVYSHKPELDNPMFFKFLIPDNIQSDHAILRFNWQMSIACCPHKYLCADTYHSDLASFSTVDNGHLCMIASMAPEIQVCGDDCPNNREAGCLLDYTYIRNCADVRIKSPSDCTQSNGDCTWTDRDVAEVVSFPGTCGSSLTGVLADCENIVAATKEDFQLCVRLCHSIFSDPQGSAAFWCRLAGNCDLLSCTAAYSYGKCSAPTSRQAFIAERNTTTQQITITGEPTIGGR
eukprot:Gregarina_sp_Poly_1__4895@NODE_25_length_19863_cov_179_262730_g23_i0_p7_GENE_NODE_25_length_19863_cov_179_262730_g23_i0NODE_25_length_19863_cov_179_262730_g23_i0_p7_ORF_typecomplete_len374_score13_63_NODE_25_length_19863_cov_179_262730_g23_i072848405